MLLQAASRAFVVPSEAWRQAHYTNSERYRNRYTLVFVIPTILILSFCSDVLVV
jgi:hypothetical protein